MKKIFLISILLLGWTLFSNAQCQYLGNVVSASSDTMVQMYTPASYFILPSDSNQITWQLMDIQDNIIAEEEDNLALIYFNVDLTDTLKICQTVYNPVIDSSCMVCDSLSYQGNIVHWAIFTSNGGMDVTSISSPATQYLNSFPNPAHDWVKILYPAIENKEIKLRIVNSLGAIAKPKYFINQYSLNINTEDLPQGLYFVELWIDSQQKNLSRFIKL